MAESQDSQIPWNAETRIACTFSFQCPKTWDQLCETDNPTMRYCLHCNRDVLLVQTEADFSHYREQGGCIAVPVVPSDKTSPAEITFGTPGPTPEQIAETQRLAHEWLENECSIPEPTPVSEVPEGMVLIPKGPFLYGDKNEKVIIDYDYYMAIYSVTNDQYKEFVLANGYGSQDYWSKEGWAWKQNTQVNGQEHLTDSQWNIADHPVGDVSYYEAEAYATWAGKRLPTEQEWEKAARGTEGQKYPWGDEFEFDGSKCNYSNNASWFTPSTPVTKYPEGQSPYGCYDMAGNVWEWCAGGFDQSNSEPVSRGGSHGSTPYENNSPADLRSAVRYSVPADFPQVNIGFRLAQDIP